MGRLRARDFDRTIRRRVDLRTDRMLRKCRESQVTTVKRAIDVRKAFAIDEPSEEPPEYDVDPKR